MTSGPVISTRAMAWHLVDSYLKHLSCAQINILHHNIVVGARQILEANGYLQISSLRGISSSKIEDRFAFMCPAWMKTYILLCSWTGHLLSQKHTYRDWKHIPVAIHILFWFWSPFQSRIQHILCLHCFLMQESFLGKHIHHSPSA